MSWDMMQICENYSLNTSDIICSLHLQFAVSHPVAFFEHTDLLLLVCNIGLVSIPDKRNCYVESYSISMICFMKQKIFSKKEVRN